MLRNLSESVGKSHRFTRKGMITKLYKVNAENIV